jgi:hypothetical protein
MFGFGKKNSVANLDDLKKLMKREGNNFPNVVKEMADNGNIICQEFMATVVLNLMDQAPNLETKRKIHTDFIRYAIPVAKSGNSGMQFNLGLSYSKTLDSDEDYIDQDGLNRLREARYWMREAADQGMQEALDSFHSLDKLISSIETRLEDEDEDEGFTILDQLKLASEHVKFSKTMEELHPRDFGDVKGVIHDIGLERASQLYAHIVRQKIKNRKDRLQFILEELDGASQGNEKAKEFVRKSGIPAYKYSGALDRSYPAVDGPDGPQQFLRMVSMRLMSNQELMVDFTLSVVRRIMDDHGL